MSEIMQVLAYSAIGLAGAVFADVGIKMGRGYPLLKKAHELITNQIEARKDNQLTVKEKAQLYDDIEGLIFEAYDIMKGILPFKSSSK